MQGLTSRLRHRLPRIHKRNFSSSEETVFVAIGSNLGNRARNIHEALQALREHVSITNTSFLYESKAMYKTDQPSFLNAAIQVTTKLAPHDLLTTLKDIEKRLGRDGNHIRNGPRTIDLDILTYGRGQVNDIRLTIPHPRIAEREFVIQPLCDIHPGHTIGECTAEELLQRLHETTSPNLIRVTPTKTGRLFRWGERTLLMGIINATPDSFSDGGVYNTCERAIEQAGRFVEAGFDIIDIGGQSTRPGASEIPAEEELQRVLPIITRVAETYPDVSLSVDTFHESVAREALAAGADVVNDVTAGDGGTIPAVRNSGAMYIAMHMRGSPKTMQSLASYHDVVTDVSRELSESIRDVIHAGIPRWGIVADPGIGFAKTGVQNRELVQRIPEFREGAGDFPVLLGISRKSWLCEEGDSSSERDFRTAGVLGAAVAKGGVDIVRVHSENVGLAVRAAELVAR